MHISRVFSVISAIICAAMPKACTFEAPLADSFEDSRAIREIFRSRKALLGWKSEEEKGLPSLKALGFNTKVMCKFAEVFCSRCSCVKSPPIAWIRKEVKQFATLMSLEQTPQQLHMDCWGLKKLFSTAIRRWGVPIGCRKDPGVDAFYKVVLRHWQHLLPDLAKVPKVVLIDLSEMTEASPNAKRVKREIIEIVKIEDDDEENEEEQFKKLPETSLTLDEINEKIEYLRACCDDGYGVLVDEDSGKAPVKEQVETQLVEAGELDAAAERVKKEEEAREGQEIPVVSRVGQFQQREYGKQDMPESDYAALATAPEDRSKPAPSTPKTGTSIHVPSTKKDHETAKKLLRSEKLYGSDETRRYLFEDPILDKDDNADARSFSTTDEEKQREVLLDTVRQARLASWGEDPMMTKFTVLPLPS
ncbi:unnamed protein product [Symbiodinium microadriaticum]|nr:unnamed protein product [Symbiodinium microadriaticum]